VGRVALAVRTGLLAIESKSQENVSSCAPWAAQAAASRRGPVVLAR
jgi:hypothetical protein